MLISFEHRPSDSPFIDRVWRSHSEGSGEFLSMAACNWEMVVSKFQGKTFFTVRGPESKATKAICPPDGEWFSIRFKVGTYLTLFPPSELRDRNDVNLADASSRSFWLNGSAWEYPDFENAETFVDRLAKRGLIGMDPLVSDVLKGRDNELSTRTAQRRFLKVTGLTLAAIEQIERARRATLLLKDGHSILDATFEAGYYDQAHLTRSLQLFVGQTPGQISRSENQLSFLYKTDQS